MTNRRRLLGNIGWLLADRLFRMGLGLVVGVWVARYLGPGNFGLLNYAMALVSLFTTVAALGLGDIVVRDIIRQPDRTGAILGTALGLQLAGGLAALLLAVATVIVLRPGETGVWSVTALCALVLLGQCGDTIRSWFEAKVQSRNVVWVANGVFAVATLARIAGVLLHKPLLWYSIVYGLEAMLTTAALVVMMWRHERDGPATMANWRFEPARARAMLAVSWPLALSGVAIVLNMKIDQVMLGQMLDDGAVGLFSAAVRISEVWYFIPVAIAASAYPFIAREPDPQLMALRWSQLYAVMLWVAVGAAGFATLFSGWIVNLLYGPAYAAAAPVLVVHIWSGVNVALGLVWSRWIVLENQPRMALLVQTIGAALNIGFNLVLIPRYGIMGAALATLGSYWLSGTLSYLVHRPAVTLGYIGRALTPWRLVGRFATRKRSLLDRYPPPPLSGADRPTESTLTLNIAIIGAGPAGYYTAEAALKHWGGAARIDIIDRLPTPYGLIRAGVAPDHQSIKAVTRRYEATNLGQGVRFVGNVMVGRDVSVAELLELYDAVVLSVGAPEDKPIGIPGDDLPGVLGSAAFVGWYNGHPDYAGLDVPLSHHGAAIIGNGNVAIDCARILAKTIPELETSDIAQHAVDALRHSAIRDIHIVGRRGPHQASFTTKEAGELGHLERAHPIVRPGDLPPLAEDAALEPGHRKMVTHLRSFAGTERGEKPVTINFEFFRRPVAVEGNGRAERLIVETTRLENGAAVGTGELHAIPCGLVIACIGYRTSAIPGVAFDDRLGRFPGDEQGRIMPGLYASGWARRGPSGTIGTNRPDGFSVVEAMVADGLATNGGDAPAALDALLAGRGVRSTHFGDWQNLDAAEIARARPGAPREKLVSVTEMLGLIG